MSTLIVDELHTTLSQDVTFNRQVMIATIRPHLYFHNMPSGVFNLNIYKGGNLIKSFSFTSANAKAAANLSENYFHIYYSLSTTPFMLPRGTYEIKLEHSGYTFNTSSWMGWCKDLVPFGRLTGTPSDFTENPFSFTILEYQPREI